MYTPSENLVTGQSLTGIVRVRRRPEVGFTVGRAGAARGTNGFAIGMVLATLCAVPTFAQTSTNAKNEPDFARPELATLDLFIGAWTVRENHFDTQGRTVGSVTGTEEISWSLDRHVIRRSYSTFTEPTVYRAKGTLGWNELDKRFEGTWYDNFYFRGPTRVTATWNDETKTMIHEIEARAEDGSTTKYKRVEQFLNEKRRVATTYEITGDTVIKRMVVNYKRSVPCPPAVFPIFNESVKTKGE